MTSDLSITEKSNLKFYNISLFLFVSIHSDTIKTSSTYKNLTWKHPPSGSTRLLKLNSPISEGLCNEIDMKFGHIDMKFGRKSFHSNSLKICMKKGIKKFWTTTTLYIYLVKRDLHELCLCVLIQKTNHIKEYDKNSSSLMRDADEKAISKWRGSSYYFAWKWT